MKAVHSLLLSNLVLANFAFAQSDRNYFPAELRQSCAVKKHQADAFDWRAQVAPEATQVLSLSRQQAIESSLRSLEQYSKQKSGWTSRIAQDLALRLQEPAFKNKVIEVAQDRVCAKGVSFEFQILDGLLAVKKQKAETEQTIAQIEAISNKAILCTAPMALRSVLRDLPEQGSVDLSGSSFFEDNSSELTEPQQQSFEAKMESELAKFKKMGCKTRIQSIEVLTSSNYKPNSEKIGRFKFLELSTRRAEYLKSIILKIVERKVADGSLQMARDASTLISIDPKGENGDGTSGPCPYRIEDRGNQKWIVKDESLWASEAMTKARYGRVSFELSYEGDHCSDDTDSPVGLNYFAAKCAQIDISCRR